jgi:hypothetical protein
MALLVYLVHGMGVRADAGDNVPKDEALFGWYKDPVEALRALPAKYGLSLAFDMHTGALPDGRAFDYIKLGQDTVNCTATLRAMVVPVSYADVLDDTLTALAATEEKLGTELLNSGGSGIDRALADWLDGNANPDAGFGWTHIADVVLLRFDAETRKAVRRKIAQQLVAAETHKADGMLATRVFITHSLGTFATTDTLQAMSTAAVAEGLPSFGVGSWDLEAFVTLANVTRVLSASVGDPYRFVVRPRTVTAPAGSGMVRTYRNVQHALDPIPLPWAFNRPPWQPDYDYQFAELTAIKHLNVHGFTHYLNDPRAHCALLNLLCVGARQVTKEQFAKAVAEYEQPTGGDPCADAIATLRDTLVRVTSEVRAKQQPTLHDVLPWILDTVQAIHTARGRCAGGFKL